jgi:hypothetical protein
MKTTAHEPHAKTTSKRKHDVRKKAAKGEINPLFFSYEILLQNEN